MAQRRWLTIAVFFLLGLLGGGALTYFQTPQYESKARVFVSAAPDRIGFVKNACGSCGSWIPACTGRRAVFAAGSLIGLS